MMAAAFAAGLTMYVAWQSMVAGPSPWTEAEVAQLRSLSLASLPPLPPDPSNAVADDAKAAAFGERLFFDPRLSANGGISCATCHQPLRHFTDGLKKGQAIGTSKRNTPGIVGTAYSPWFYWDGRRDSQWAQALSPLEDPNEHGMHRLGVVDVVAEDPSYRTVYTGLFGALPEPDNVVGASNLKSTETASNRAAEWSAMTESDRHAVNRAFANIGKAIAAFERTLLPGATRFDGYVAAVISGDGRSQAELFSDDEVRGLRLFIGEANCLQCHNGPLLTNNEFHNTGVISAPRETPDTGRAAGVRDALADPFNCLGAFSDDPTRSCDELDYVRTGEELIGAVRTPSLRNVAMTAPYMHKGQLASIAEVLVHYNEAPEAMIGHNEAEPLGLSSRELGQLEAFLGTLSSPVREFQSDNM